MIPAPLVFNAFSYLIVTPDGSLLRPLRCFTEPVTGSLWLGQQHGVTLPTLHEVLWRRHAEQVLTHKHLELDVYLLPPVGVPNRLRRLRVRYRTVRWLPIDLMEGLQTQALEWLVLEDAMTVSCQDLSLKDCPPALIKEVMPERPDTPPPPPPQPPVPVEPPPPQPPIDPPPAPLLPMDGKADPNAAARPDKADQAP